MKIRTSIALIYLLAAVSTTALILSQNSEVEVGFGWLVSRLVIFALPLLFVFAYPRHLLASSPEKKHLWFAIVLNVLGSATAILLFPYFANFRYPDTPVSEADSLAIPILLLTVPPVFVVAALYLLLKNRSTLATFASILLWPYMFLLSLVSLDRFFEESPFNSTLYLICFLSPTLLAFAAGALPYRPTFAHATALLAAASSMPWIYRTEVRGYELGNPWIMFNLSEKEAARGFAILREKLAILAVALIVVATVTAILRLLPARWRLREVPLSERTWPAFAASFLFLAIWFCQSVMPYRLPGAMDGARWPDLQILHIEKRGLQFHETCVTASRRDQYSVVGSFSVTTDDRRLFHYGFQEKYSSGPLPQVLMQRVLLMLELPSFAKREIAPVKPLRAWNADGWYFRVGESGIRSYTTENGAVPPQEIVSLFHDLEATPRSWNTESNLRDVCLGFCYDPKSAMGFLYCNQRCFDDGHGFHCE